MTEYHLIWRPSSQRNGSLWGLPGTRSPLEGFYTRQILRAITHPVGEKHQILRRGWLRVGCLFCLKTTSNRQIKGGEHVSNTTQEIKSTAARACPIEERVSVSIHLKTPDIVNTSSVPTTIIIITSSPYPRIVSVVARHSKLYTHLLI